MQQNTDSLKVPDFPNAKPPDPPTCAVGKQPRFLDPEPHSLREQGKNGSRINSDTEERPKGDLEICFPAFLPSEGAVPGAAFCTGMYNESVGAREGEQGSSLPIFVPG